MAAKIYAVGDRFGRWTLLEVLPPDGTNRKWWVRCLCGTEATVFAGNLTTGKSRGCGPCGARERSRRA